MPPSHRPTGPRRAPFVLLVAGLLGAGLCLLLALNTASAAAELRRHALVEANASLAAAVQQATSDLAAKQAPGALAAAAAKLGMVANSNPGYLTVHRDGTVTVLGSPAAATSPPPPAPATTKAAAPSRKPTATGKQRAKPTAARPTPKVSPPTTSAPLPGGAR